MNGDRPITDFAPDELGVDSLVAVDIQSWFRKELGIDLPLMKIHSANSIDHLIILAQELVGSNARPRDTGENAGRPYEFDSQDVEHSSHVNHTGPIGTVAQKHSTTEGEPKSTVPSSTTSNRAESTSASDVEILIAEADFEPVPNHSKPEKSLGQSRENVGPSEDLVDRRVPMSFAQSRFWFLRHFLETETAFNVTTVIRLRGKLDVDRLKRASQEVGQLHQAIRTAFYTDAATRQHIQAVLKAPTLCFEHYIGAGESFIQDAIREVQDTRFNLSKGESVRLRLLTLPDDMHIIILGYHHIVMDGIGNNIFLSDMEKVYHGLLDTKGRDMLQYPGFSLRQQNEHKKGLWAEQLAFWRCQFNSLPPPLPLLHLSHKSVRPEASTFVSHSTKVRIDKQLEDQIKQYCRQLKISPLHFYLAIFRILLLRHSQGQAQDMCIGIADANRRTADVLRSLGLFLNFLPLRFRHTSVDRDCQPTFHSILEDTRNICDNAFANSVVPFDVMLTELNVPRSMSRTPLFQSLFNYRQNIRDARNFCGCEAEGELIAGGQSAYDVSMDVLDSSSRESSVALVVNSDIYTGEDARVLLESYLCLMREFSRDPGSKISRVPLYFKGDADRAIQLGTGRYFP